ncbi:MAG: hypothetical protein COB22_07355 [Cycloclasticus sp.]|nr:MAG: hypothetical protein COB22_07355 [Cycloclasticus sp.]
MNSKRKPYKTYTREFKVEAVRLMSESDRPSSQLAAELGIRRGIWGPVFGSGIWGQSKNSQYA